MISQELNSFLWEKKKYRDEVWKKYNRRRIQNELDMLFDDLIEPIIEADDNNSYNNLPDVTESSDDGSSVVKEPVVPRGDNKSYSNVPDVIIERDDDSIVGKLAGVPRGITCKESCDDASSVGYFSLDEQSFSLDKSRSYSSFGKIPKKITSTNPKIFRPYNLPSFDEEARSLAFRSVPEEEQEDMSLSSKYFSVATSSRSFSRDSESISGASFYTTDNSSIISLKARKRSIERSVARYPDYCN